MYKDKMIKIACDGGAGTGKSTAAKLISKKYGLKFLSSGLLYRYASYLILKHKPKNKIKFIEKRFKKFNYKSLSKINLHTPEISSSSAKIAKLIMKKNTEKVSIKLFEKIKNCCIEGRDIATKILPKADIKFFKCNINIVAGEGIETLKN